MQNIEWCWMTFTVDVILIYDCGCNVFSQQENETKKADTLTLPSLTVCLSKERVSSWAGRPRVCPNQSKQISWGQQKDQTDREDAAASHLPGWGRRCPSCCVQHCWTFLQPEDAPPPVDLQPHGTSGLHCLSSAWGGRCLWWGRGLAGCSAAWWKISWHWLSW